MNMQTTRRALLGSMALAPIAGAAVALPAATPDRAAWDRAMEKHLRTKEIAEAYSRDVHDPTHEAVERMAPFHGNHFEVRAKNGQTATYLYDDKKPDAYDGQGRAFAAAIAKMKDANRRHQEARVAMNADAIAAESDRLYEAAHQAERALVRLPAPDLPALLYKLELHFGEEAREDGGCPNWIGDILDSIMADARRLLGGEAQHG